uniref:NADH-ubiquinone oxidoreductase chain 5 n=1 Tax=Stenopirates sp. HL-2011 TaxID=1085627 RepID=G3K2L2_9HEMI|nr:NADH dehydrogenase subunit 5 [Stenopirates sp. HL-2011]AEK26849.1 NADH dehydrogenase subunit 5 [Stenopirates sp. HL-2011]
MFKLSFYIIWSFILFLLSLILFFFSLILLNMNFMIFLDWEILMINSCSLMMTFIIDWMSMIFSSCVFMISSMVLMYSEVYMENDKYKIRFLYLILLFILSMFMMIMSPNLMSILIGWDGLGLVSYCLVIYFQNFKSYNAGMLTILMNRIGDVGILLSISWMLNFGNWHYIYYMMIWENWMIYFILLLVLAGFTKSAQIPFSSWLPAAMAAPTPVSSLVHSSTLVTAGVYLLIRFNNLFNNFNCTLLVFLSLMTMFMSGIGANFEYDLKKIIALSTLSQLGLMMSILLLKFPILAFFHLLTHAFFKALLFLCAGMIIHNMNNSQDIRHMGNLINQMPFTISCFVISSLSLCGIPFLSGFYSKDLILEMYLFDGFNFFFFFFLHLSVGLTVMYSFRLIYYSLNMFMNGYVIQSYYENKIMNFSMLILLFLSVFFGSMLMWLIFINMEFIFLSFNLKMLSIFFIILGMFIGYSNYLYKNNLNFKFIYFMFFFSFMWFLPNMSTYMIYSKNYFISNQLVLIMDMGWCENIFSKMIFNIISMFNNIIQYFENNNFKLFMFSFFFIILMMLI